MRMTQWSPEILALLDPAAAFRELDAEPAAGVWTLLRRPLLLALLFGCTVSLWASGRLTQRLVVDGMVSFAFVPVFEILSLAVVYRRGPRRVPFARAVDGFFVGNAPWLLWLLAFSVLRCLQTPRQATALSPWLTLTLLLSLIPAASAAAYIDLRFFREVQPRRAAGDLVLQRIISWTCILGYYVGHELWELVAARIGV
jgi:hypothetical protein